MTSLGLTVCLHLVHNFKDFKPLLIHYIELLIELTLPNCDDFANGQSIAIELTDKDSCYCFVECSTVHVDCCSNGQHKSSHPLIDT